MRSSSIYNYTQVYLAPTDYKQYQAKTTVAGRNYFLYPLPLSTPRLSIDNNEYRIIDQHLSYYSEYQDNSPGFEAYHLTIRVAQGPIEFIIHCYFKLNGNATDVTMKQDDTPIELSSSAQKKLQDYGIQTSSIIQTLNKSLHQKQGELQEAIASKQQQVDELSKDLTRNFKPYMAALRELINLAKEFNFIINNCMANEQNLLEKIFSVCEQRQISTKKPAIKKSKSKKATKPAKDTPPPTVKGALIPEEKEGKAEIEILEAINIKLTFLEGTDLPALRERQQLLQTKLKLIPATDFEDILTSQIPGLTFKLALQGDIEAANAILANNYLVRFNFYFTLIHHEQEKVFDILFSTCSIQNFLINVQAIMPDSHKMPVDMLTIAYHKKNKSLFSKLLFTYHCNPNLMDVSGRQLLHEMAAKGDILYAQMMLAAGANVNTMAEEVSGISWFMQPTETLSGPEKNNFQKT